MISPKGRSEREWKIAEWKALLISAILLAGNLWRPPVLAQDVDFVLTGYGTTEYEAQVTDSLCHNFTASFSPVSLFQMGEDVLFESEIDFELQGRSTQVPLEHA